MQTKTATAFFMQEENKHNSLILRRVARMGGGKSHLLLSSHRRFFAPLIPLLLFLFILAGCTPAGDTICGVPVQGSPWALAAAIKAYIRGWFYQPDSTRSDTSGGDGFQPAEVICDLDAGEVTHAFLVIPEFIPK